MTYSMTSTHNYFVAPEFAMDAESNLIHHNVLSSFAAVLFFCLVYLKSRRDVHIFKGKVLTNSDMEDNVIVSL